jgi:hypothetical protein
MLAGLLFDNDGTSQRPAVDETGRGLGMMLGEHQGREGDEPGREGYGNPSDQFFFAGCACGCHGWHIMENVKIIKAEAIFRPKMLVPSPFCRSF